MSKANPYAVFLDERPVDAILTATPEVLRSLIADIGDEVETRPAPGKWSAAEIACHLADCEMVFGFRLRQMLAEENPAIQPFNQEKWADNYLGVAADQAVEVFAVLRGWNLQLIETSLPAAAKRTATHPERGVFTFQSFVELIAGHDLNHLSQLRKLADAPRSGAAGAE